jgi:FkbM family methyltransferase
MLISLDKIVKDFNSEIRGVIHIGAHYGQECDSYLEQGIKNLMFFEPIAANYKKLLANLPKGGNIKTFNNALGNYTGTKVMYVETDNDGQSCSLLAPGTHLSLYPNIKFDKSEVVWVDKLDQIPFDRGLYNMINIDVQGYELEVFRGAANTLRNIDIVYTEINTEAVYKGCPLIADIDAFLRTYGMERIMTHFPCRAWGDAYYKRIR